MPAQTGCASRRNPVRKLEDRVAIVTGAGGGIGLATALLLAEHGAKVAVADLRLAAAQATASAVRAAGGEAIAFKADLALEADTIALVESTLAAYGRIDILHNNAADQAPEMSPPNDGDVETTPIEVWDRALLVNVRGTALVCKHVLPIMVAQGGGSIINTGSNLGLQGNLVQVAYAASKAALLQMSRSIAVSHGRRGVRCNAVSPGLTLTPAMAANLPDSHRQAVEAETLTPYLGQPHDIAAAVVFLASDDARYVTGHNLVVDGGTAIHVPGFERLQSLWA
jgi:NAD(P)-dependent dehydrogenase (short-subunit alcohol dehydrogenase family)